MGFDLLATAVVSTSAVQNKKITRTEEKLYSTDISLHSTKDELFSKLFHRSNKLTTFGLVLSIASFHGYYDPTLIFYSYM